MIGLTDVLKIEIPMPSCDISCLTTKIIVDEVVTFHRILLNGGKLNFCQWGGRQSLKQLKVFILHEFIQGKVGKITIQAPNICVICHNSSVFL